MINSGETNYLEIVRGLLENGVNPNKLDEYGNNVFHSACRNEHISFDFIKLLFEYKADPNIKNGLGSIPLHIICENLYSSLEIFKIIFEKSTDPYAVNKAGMAPLHYACLNSNANLEIVNILIENDPDPNLKNKLNWILFHICENETPKLEIVKFLLINGADPNLMDKYKYKANLLQSLCQKENPNFEVVKVLLEFKSDPNFVGDIYRQTAFHLAYENKNFTNVDILKLLLENIKDLNLKYQLDQTLLHFVCNQEILNFEIIKFLLENKADPNIQDNFFGQTPFCYACTNKNSDIQLVNFFLERKADPYQKSKYNEFIIESFCRTKNPNLDILKLLFEKFLDKNIKTKKLLRSHCIFGNLDIEIIRFLYEKIVNPNNSSFLQAVCKNENSKIKFVKIFLEKKADPNYAKKHGYSTLESVCRNKNPNLDVIKCLIENKANPNNKDKFDHSLLELVCTKKTPNLDVAKCLIANRADPNITNQFGRTLLQLVFDNTNLNIEIIKFLFENVFNKQSYRFYKDKSTFLHIACEKKQPNFEVICFLIEKGINLNAENELNQTCLNLYLKKGINLNTEDELDELDSYIIGNNRTNLLFDTQKPIDPILGLLLRHGADVSRSKFWKYYHYSENCANLRKRMIMEILNEENISKDCYERILTLADKPDIFTGKAVDDYSNTFLHLFFAGCSNFENTKSVFKLFTGDLQQILNRTNKSGNTCLHLACRNENIDVNTLEFLIGNGCNVNTKNNYGDTCLHLVCLNKFPAKASPLEFFIKEGADLTILNEEGHSAYQVALKNTNFDKRFTNLLRYEKTFVLLKISENEYSFFGRCKPTPPQIKNIHRQVEETLFSLEDEETKIQQKK